MWGTVLVAAAAFALLTTIVLSFKDRERLVRGVLWFSFFAAGFVPANDASAGASVAVSDSDALRVAIPAACLALALLTTRAKWRGIQAPEIFLGLFLFVVFASTTWSHDPKSTILKAVAFLIQWVTLLVLVRRYDTYRAAIIGLTNAVHLVLLSIVTSVILAPTQALGGAPLGRLSGVYPAIHPNMLGLLTVIGLLSLVTNVAPPWIEHRVGLRAVLGILYIVELLGARTRAALVIGALVIGLALFRLALRHKRAGLGFLTLVTFGLILFVARADQVFLFLQRGQDANQISTLSGRTSIWQAGLDLWQQQPIQGFGYYVGHRVELVPLFQGSNQSNLDNMWVEVLVDLGYLGLIPLALLLILGTIRAVRTARESGVDILIFTGSALLLLWIATSFNPSLQTVSVPAMLLGTILMASVRNRRLRVPKASTPVGYGRELSQARIAS